MTKLKFILVLWAFVSILACKNERVDMAGYMKERDSLIIENQANKEELAELNSIISTVSAGLDSIAIQEGILYSGKTRDGVALNRNQIIANINSMAEILKRQREKIQSLQDSLAMRSANSNKSSQSIEKLQNVIAFLNKQLAEKIMKFSHFVVMLILKTKTLTSFVHRCRICEIELRKLKTALKL